jgi:hypothetical protein
LPAQRSSNRGPDRSRLRHNRASQFCALLVDFTGASFDPETVRTMKESAVFDKPYIRKSAWIGASNYLEDVHEQLEAFSRRDLPIFSSFEEAATWLAKD